MKTRRVQAGDIYSVPLGDGRSAICRVPFCSTYFRDLVQLSLFGWNDRAKVAAEQCAGLPIAQLFTGQDCAQGMQWELLGSTPVTLDDERISKRVVAGEIWIGDTWLGPAEGENAAAPKMLVHGCAILRKALLRALE